MNYTIETANINDLTINLEIRKLLKAANNTTELLPDDYLEKKICSNASHQSFFLIAIENGGIIGCNGFIANDFFLNDINYTGYQSCMSATHPLHQGKRVFTSIINFAKEKLTAEGAGFLYGIANNTSNPIFTKKLGFTENPTLILSIPNLPFFKWFYFRKEVLKRWGGCTVDEEQVKNHKLNQCPNLVKVVQYNDSWIWGKVLVKKRIGIKFSVFYVGGVSLATDGDLEKMLTKIYSIYKVFFIQFFLCKTNSLIHLLKGWKKPKMNGFIFYNLNMPNFQHLNIMIGVLDVF